MYERSAAQNQLSDCFSPVHDFAIITTVVILTLFFVAGCGTLPNGRGWGQDAFVRVDAGRVSRAAHNAFFNSNTLVPLVSALVFSIDDFDERVSDWAIKHNPVFGSEANARDASDYLRATLRAEAIIRAIAIPSGRWNIPNPSWIVISIFAFSAASVYESANITRANPRSILSVAAVRHV